MGYIPPRDIFITSARTGRVPRDNTLGATGQSLNIELLQDAIRYLDEPFYGWDQEPPAETQLEHFEGEFDYEI